MTESRQKYEWLGGALKLRQLGAGQLQSGIAKWSVGQIQLVYETNNLKAELIGRSPPGVMVVLIPDIDESFSINCRLVNDDQMVLLCPGNELRMVNNIDQTMLALQIPVPMISSQFKTSEQKKIGDFDFAHPRVITDGESIAYLRRLAMDSRFVGASGEWPQVMEMKIAEQLKILMSNHIDEWHQRPDRMTSRRVKMFKNLNRYLESNSSDKISLSDLTSIAAVSERTLERLFKKEVGMTPSAYVTAFRLQKAWGDLSVSNTASKTIAQIAMDRGFEHLGRFSSTYREHFGQTPSVFRQSLIQNMD